MKKQKILKIQLSNQPNNMAKEQLCLFVVVLAHQAILYLRDLEVKLLLGQLTTAHLIIS